MADPLTKLELDLTSAGGCQDPKCTAFDCKGELYLKPNCCRGAVDVSYKHNSGEIVIRCYQCHRLVTKIAVAE